MATTQNWTSARLGHDREHYPAVETHSIHSRHVAQTYSIRVMLPRLRQGEDTRFPVVYATDGNSTFDALKGISYSMQASERDAPRFILVGICYPGDCPIAGAMLRGRDLTFPQYPKVVVSPPAVDGVLVARCGAKDFAGGDDFQRFMSDELFRFVDGRYPSIEGARTYFGHSAGGGFGLYTLFSRPQLFRNYIISSPGTSYHGRSSAGVDYDNYDFIMEQVRQFADSGQSLAGVRMYMSVGMEEEFEPDLERWRLTSSCLRLVKLLKAAAIPGLTLTSEVLAGESHMTVWPIAFMHGIQAVFRSGRYRDGSASQ